MNKNFVVGAIVVIVILGLIGAYTLYLKSQTGQPVSSPTTKSQFSDPKKSPHYVSNTPIHESIIPAPPINVVIDFNFDLSPKSSITITKGSRDYGSGPTTVDSTKLSLRRAVSPASPNGLYTVNYTACWPDDTCDDGQFQFAIDRSLSSQYQDMRNKSQVEIYLKNSKFEPSLVRITKGTTVVWTNTDSIGHYINTDPHAGHSYYPPQNSKLLNKDESFSLKFDTSGFYSYHCSAHASNMTASILVE